MLSNHNVFCHEKYVKIPALFVNHWCLIYLLCWQATGVYKFFLSGCIFLNSATRFSNRQQPFVISINFGFFLFFSFSLSVVNDPWLNRHLRSILILLPSSSIFSHLISILYLPEGHHLSSHETMFYSLRELIIMLSGAYAFCATFWCGILIPDEWCSIEEWGEVSVTRRWN